MEIVRLGFVSTFLLICITKAGGDCFYSITVKEALTLCYTIPQGTEKRGYEWFELKQKQRQKHIKIEKSQFNFLKLL